MIEEEKMKNLSWCDHCHYLYLFCECEKEIKDYIRDKEYLKDLLETYKSVIGLKTSETRNQFIKELNIEIKNLKDKILC